VKKNYEKLDFPRFTDKNLVFKVFLVTVFLHLGAIASLWLER